MFSRNFTYQLIFLLGILFTSGQVFAQNDDEDFDYFEDVEKEKDIDLFNNAQRNSITRKRDDRNSSFMHPGNVIVGPHLYFQDLPRSVATPAGINAEVTVVRNFTVGLFYSTYRFKGWEYLDPELATTSEWQSHNLKVRDQFFGLQGSFHFTEILGLNYSLFDLYAKGIVGFNSINGKTEVLKYPIEDYESLRWMLAVGVRYIYNEKITVFMDLGRHQYGLVNFGVNYRVIGD